MKTPVSKPKRNYALEGFITELKARIWLRECGFEVYYNDAPVGKGDMVIWMPGKPHPYPIDVKTFSLQNHAAAMTGDTLHDLVRALWYDKERDTFTWNAVLLVQRARANWKDQDDE